MQCLKALGEGIVSASRDPRPSDHLKRGGLRIALMNRFNALGIAEVVAPGITSGG